MKENQKKAFDFAADTTKQLITLSTAIITLSVTFSKDIVGGAESSPRTFLILTWAVFIFSIFFGILTLMALTGTLHPLEKKKVVHNEKDITENKVTQGRPDGNELAEININKGNIRGLSTIQVLLFVAALIMTALYGYLSLPHGNTKNDSQETYLIIRQSKLGNDSTIYIDTLYLPKK